MNFSLGQLFLVGFTYLLFLFGTAYVTDRGWLPSKLVRHPITYVLSLGVYASAWTFYGAIGLAHDYGYGFLISYFGASAAFILAPILLIPLLRITRTYQLSSIADLFAFRFRSQHAGTFVTLLMVLASLPLLSIQIQTVTDTIHILNNEVSADRIAFVFCGLIAAFAVLFGARHPSIRQKHEGLVVAMAVASLIKLIALSALGLYCLLVVFGGNDGLESWLAENQSTLNFHYSPMEDDAWRTLLLAFFTSAIVMPHMFHMLFTENLNPKALSKASWGVPLFLLVLAIAIPPILWGGIKLQLDSNPEYFGLILGIQQGSPTLTVIAFIGGLSAASGVLIISAIALSGMVINHIFLPFYQNHGNNHLYQRLIWARRAVIFVITLLSFLFYMLIARGNEVSQLGLVAFVAFMQFLPGLLATLFWPGGNRLGFVIGLTTGIGIWLVTMLVPLLGDSNHTLGFDLGATPWHLSAVYSLAANVGIFLLISMSFKPSKEELHAANSCALNALHRPQGEQLAVTNVQELVDRLSPRIGIIAAWREVRQALDDLQLHENEIRPKALGQLRDRLEINLSALLGPVEAITLLAPDKGSEDADSFRNKNIHLLENNLERYHNRLSGLAAELDELRRHHRQTLQKLPIGVCSVGRNKEILLWNTEIERFTGIENAQAIGQELSYLPPPWGELLLSFAQQDHPHLHNEKVMLGGSPHWFSLHKAAIDDPTQEGFCSQAILLEDQTETQLLADELVHSERLASIGRLAAGVAHEIGNPITGIACLAQNLHYETKNPEVLEAGEQILEQTRRVDRIVKSLMNFAHAGNHSTLKEHRLFSINDSINDAISLVRLHERGKQLNYLNLCKSEHQTLGDPQRLLQVFVNLLNNAADASEPGMTIRIDSRQESHSLIVTVEDQGTGIPAEIQKQLFEPFFTTKEPGKGTGLGLALVYSIVEEHYGSVQIESPADKAQNRGVRVVLKLPNPQ
ncbi:ATP-binding protein [Motiliproteus sp. MSK22-1]|uniref:sensor histidine kinase n=1 Tax=Motiliproteus sp. MSK22-1 TaxID=1897630 RepID=UPI00097893D3|nr:ATP-binding protein [Motiliproteus sp. MSK22-1]OMH32049.1 ATPase [Motiliproteus sp. MSK22-1]